MPYNARSFLDPFGLNKLKKKKSPKMNERQTLFKELKQEIPDLKWNKVTTKELKALAANRSTNLINKIIKLGDDKMILSINDFNRVINDIPATTERSMMVRLIDINGEPRDDSVKLTEDYFENKKGSFGFIGAKEGFGSDADYEDIDDNLNGNIEIEWISPKIKSRSEVEFFRYLTKECFFLKDFQVFHSSEAIDNKPCFIKALEMNNVSKDTINRIIESMYKNAASMTFIKSVAEKFSLYFEIKTNAHIIRYGNPENQNVSLGIVADHIFANLETEVTKQALLNPQYSNSEYWPTIKITNSHGKKVIKPANFDSKLSAFVVINHLFKHRETMLDPITMQNAPKIINNKFAECDRLGEFINEEDIDYDFGLDESEDNRSKELNYKNIVFADLETLVINVVHTPYTASWKINDNVVENKYGFNCIKSMLYNIPDSSIIWFHNLGFDIRFLIKYLSISSRECLIETGNSMKRIKAKYFGKNLCFQDTKAFLAMPLKDMPEMFYIENLDKECFPHDLMNENTYNKPMLWSYIVDNFKDHQILLENAEKIGAMLDCDGELYLNIKKYAIHYCNKDVEVLASCFTKFRQLIKERFDQDVYAFVSLPSLAQFILRDEDCFEGCVSLKGELLNFCRKAIVGGRVMTCENKKWHVEVFDTYSIINGTRIDHHKEHYSIEETELVIECVKQGGISDFDAVSLYPSAMVRLPGLPIGAPIITRNDPRTIPFNGDLIAKNCESFHDIEEYNNRELNEDELYEKDQIEKYVPGTYYISRVLITSLNKPRKFPLQSLKTKDGTRDFTNDIVGKEIVIDQYALEDLVKFQEVEFEYIESLVWNNGFNNKLSKTMRNMFNERLRLKKEGNPLQNVIKLLMNSAYGKLIQKPIVQTKKIIVNYPAKDGEKFKDNIANYTRASIKRLISRHDIARLPTGEVSHSLFIEHKPIIKHSSPAHLGVAILSMSKRIMNEVMCLAEDLEMPIYYQDTDSMHIARNSVDALGEFFKDKYGRELIGKDLGQFHSDFALKGAEGDIWATESIFLGKKCYMDVLNSDNGKTGFHCRMKGIPSKLITTPYETYSKLYDGGLEIFDLSESCPIAINNKSQIVCKRTKFTREIKF